MKLLPEKVVSSPDTVLRIVKEVVTDNTEYVSQNGIAYNLNINNKLNYLNIKSLLLTKQLNAGCNDDFDYDNQIIATKKSDTKCTYKKYKGYCSGFATILYNAEG